MPEQMATNATAKRTDTAEENLNDSISSKSNKGAVSAHIEHWLSKLSEIQEGFTEFSSKEAEALIFFTD